MNVVDVVPDTPLAREAHALARDTHERVLLAHSERAYRFGLLAAQAAGIEVDRELLYVATILHDLGLARPGDDHFELVGADEARTLVERYTNSSRADIVWDAIAMHTVPHLPRRHRAPEVRFLQAGSALDVFGLGRERIPANVLAEIEGAFPREELGAYFDLAFERERTHHPIGMLAAFAALDLRPLP